MALFPPGKGGEDAAKGFKGKGVLIHSLVDAQSMSLAVSITSAKGSERDEVLDLLDSIDLKTGKPGRPRKRPKQLAADKGYDARWLRYELRKRGIRPELPKRVFKKAKRKTPGPKLKKRARFVAERTFSWYQRKFRRLVVRWERKSKNFRAFVLLAFSLIWLQRLLLG